MNKNGQTIAPGAVVAEIVLDSLVGEVQQLLRMRTKGSTYLWSQFQQIGYVLPVVPAMEVSFIDLQQLLAQIDLGLRQQIWFPERERRKERHTM